MKNRKHHKINLLIAIIIVFGSIGVIFGAYFLTRKSLNKNDRSSLNEALIDGNDYSIPSEIKSIEDVANKLSPSVVSITSVKKSSGFFSLASTSAGTGIIISENGYIVTNKHVVSGDNKVAVTLADGEIFDQVDVVAVDPLNDVAFLKIRNAKGLKPAEIGDSKTLKIGQQVVAIGNALGQYKNTVTSGIISGVNRSIQATDGRRSESLTDMIQTDAAINSGNSGGPLVNAKGQVIGINTAVASEAQGIGFAIPIGAVKGMMKSIIEKGIAERAIMGVNYRQVTPEIAKQHNLPVKYGAYLWSSNGEEVIRPGGAADLAGLKEGDIITHINDAQIGRNGGVSSLVSEHLPGDKITVSIIRGNEKKKIELILDKL